MGKVFSTVAGLGALTLAFVFGGTPSNAADIKGLGKYTLGMTLSEFQRVAEEDAKTNKDGKASCDSYNKGESKICFIAHPIRNIPLFNMNFKFMQTAKGEKESAWRLAAIFTNSTGSNFFREIVDLFTARYGSPTESATQELHSGMGGGNSPPDTWVGITGTWITTT
jgi:hypothetical protein